MNKKLMVVAVAGALSAPSVVLAQASNVQMYGLFQTAYENASATGATSTASAFAVAGVLHPSLAGSYAAGGAAAAGATLVLGNSLAARHRVQNYSTRFGVRGTEDLGGGLSAVFQMESGVSAEQPAGPGAANGQVFNGALATRDTWVGLSSKSWGTVQLGYQDVPFVTMHYPIDYWVGFSNGMTTNILGTNSLGVSSTGLQGATAATVSSAMAFQRREGNSIMWRSPNWGGVEGQVMYAANEAKSNSLNGATALGTSRGIDPNLWSARLTYTNGPLYLGYGFQRMKDYSVQAFGAAPTAGNFFGSAAGSNSSTDTGNKLVAQYKFGNTQLGVIWERLKWQGAGYTGAAAQLTRLDHQTWAFSLGHQMGNAHLRASYAKAADGSCGVTGTAGGTCSTTDTGATHWSLGAMYDLSKRTQLFGYWSQVTNKAYAAYGIAMGPGFGAAATSVGLGADPRVISLGIKHAF